MRLITKKELFTLPIGSIISHTEHNRMKHMYAYKGRIVRDNTPTDNDDFWIIPLSSCLPEEVCNPTREMSHEDYLTYLRTGFKVDLDTKERDACTDVPNMQYWLWELKDLKDLNYRVAKAVSVMELYTPPREGSFDA